jgi:flagellar capping protein FliD
MQGKVTHFFLANGLSELKNGTYNDVSPFQSFDGQVNDTEFPETTDIMLEFSNASGRRIKRKTKKTGGMRKSKTNRLARKDTRQQARINARSRRLDIKEKEAETQRKVAEKIGTTTPEEAKLMEQLAKDVQNPVTPTKTGLSKNAKIGIGIGVVAVVGLIAFVVIRKMNSKKK